MPTDSAATFKITPSVKGLEKALELGNTVSISNVATISSNDSGTEVSVTQSFILHINHRFYNCVYTSFLTRQPTAPDANLERTGEKPIQKQSFHTISIGDTGITFNFEIEPEHRNTTKFYVGEHVNLLDLTAEQLQEIAAYIIPTMQEDTLVAAAAPALANFDVPSDNAEEPHATITPTMQEDTMVAAAAPAIANLDVPSNNVEEPHAELNNTTNLVDGHVAIIGSSGYCSGCVIQ